MTNNATQSPNNYQEAYALLQQNAQLMQTSTDIDIDTLMQVVDESIHAYQVCQTRILAVENALKQSFDQLKQDEQV